MNESPTPTPASGSQKRNISILALVSLVLVLSLGATVSSLRNRVQDLSEKVDKLSSSAPSKTTTPEPGKVTTIASGKDGFTMTVPDGWGPLIKDTESDFFLLGGMAQPTLGAGAKTEVRELKGFGSDGALLFAATLSKDGLGDMVQGTSQEFTIGKGDDALVGKKYSYVYPKDELEGIGYTRYQNDRQYRYIFTAKDGKKLDIMYNVYGSDPRNLSANVDAIVQSIVVK